MEPCRWTEAMWLSDGSWTGLRFAYSRKCTPQCRERALEFGCCEEVLDGSSRVLVWLYSLTAGRATINQYSMYECLNQHVMSLFRAFYLQITIPTRRKVALYLYHQFHNSACLSQSDNLAFQTRDKGSRLSVRSPDAQMPSPLLIPDTTIFVLQVLCYPTALQPMSWARIISAGVLTVANSADLLSTR